MTKLVELTPGQHGELKVASDAALTVAKGQHLIGLKVTEVAQAITCFPVFFTRASVAGDWAISAITGIELNNNLFIVDDAWDAIYQPTGMKTFPFYLMNSSRDENGYTIGIDENSKAFTEDGKPIFDDKGKASLMLSAVAAQLDEDVKNEVRSYKFCQEMEKLGLMKAMDVLVHHVDESVTTLTGLHTVNEDKLQGLTEQEFENLRGLGYLAPLYGMLMSMYQLNALIRRHNLVQGAKLVKQVTMEVSKDPNKRL
ncbi:MAG: hypothetical protein ACJA2E_000266 [Arenicella sp.]|jgi:hypothetical protein